jgi:hypothetical protein
MAEKILNTRIALKIDTLENWMSSTLPLKKGELALATVAASAGTALTEPVVMIKVGEDGVKTFKDLEWNVYAKASDVLAVCKNEASLRTFINGVIADAGIATDEALTALSGRVTTAEGKITTLEGKMTAVEGKASANETAINGLKELVGETSVIAQITKAINDLDLANTYDAKGAAAAVQTDLNAYKTSNDAAVQANANAADANAKAIAAIKDGTTIDSFADVETALAGKEEAGAAAAALTSAKAYADSLANNYDAKGAAAAAETAAKTYAKDYADGLAENYDAAGSAAQALTDAKAYTDAEIAEWVGDKTVAQQIAALDLANTYDAKGAAAAAESAAKAHATGLNTAMNTRVEALEAIDHDHANKAELDLIQTGDKAKWDAMEQNAKDYADGLDEAMDARVEALEAKFGTGEGNVDSKISAAVAAEAALREAADNGLDQRLAAVEGDYLKAADKTNLQGQIDAVKGLVGDKKVSEQIADAVTPVDNRVKAIEADYLKASDKTELEGKITANANAIELLTNGVSSEEVDGVNDLIQYVKDHGTEVTGIKADIKANSDAIAAEKARAEGIEGGLETRLAAVEGKLGDEGAVATAIAAALQSANDYTDAEVKELAEGAVATNAGAIADVKGLVGDKAVNTQITEAIDTLKNGQLTTMQGEIDAVEGRATALEGKAHEHANKAELDKFVDGDKAKLDAAVQTVTAGTGLTATKTGTDVAIAFDDACTFIFDCGDSSNV